jgi:hypothetical protein
VKQSEKVQTRHPEPGKSGPRLDREKYEHYRKAILAAIPATSEGIPFRDLPGLVRENLPLELRDRVGSIPWHTVTIKLDLEAKGEIERVPGANPQRIRKRRTG